VTADLREAFHIAAVEFLDWRRVNNEQREFGWINAETNQREYLPEPMIYFFGRPFLISRICSFASVLNGPLPPLMRALFDVLDNGMGSRTPVSYPMAVEDLKFMIAFEHESQAAAPLSQPSRVDQLRARSFEEGVKVGKATSGDGQV
jgi:hypothetical protein